MPSIENGCSTLLCPHPVWGSCSETPFFWELLVLHKSLTTWYHDKIILTLSEYIENLPPAQSVLRHYSFFFFFFRELKGHTLNLLFVIRYYPSILGLKLPVTAVKFCPSHFFLLFVWGEKKTTKNDLIASRMDFSLLLRSNNKPRKF